MAKKTVRIQNLDAVTKNLKKIFNDVKREKKLLKDIGVFSRDRIIFEARRGFSMEGNKRHKFPPLKDSSKLIRKGILKKMPSRVDDQFFKPNKSNVTLTGQLIKSFSYVVKNNAVFLFFKDPRTKLDEKDTTSNNAVYDDLESRGFGFIGLDEKSQKRVRKLVLDEFRRTIKKFFK